MVPHLTVMLPLHASFLLEQFNMVYPVVQQILCCHQTVWACVPIPNVTK